MTDLLVAPDELTAAELWVDGERYRHLFRARRLQSGDRLRLVDGAGGARAARVERVERQRARLELGAPSRLERPPLRLELLVAPPRPPRAGWLVEKAAELGAAAIHFVATARAPRRYGAAGFDRLRRIAAAAIEQSERGLLPELSGVHAWDELPELLAGAHDRRYLDGRGGPWQRPARAATVAVAVGPEGGWTSDERRRLEELGCRAVGLGTAVLRVETAAVAAAALILGNAGR